MDCHNDIIFGKQLVSKLNIVSLFTNGECMIPIIMSGGSGQRLWPISKEKTPKQFLEIFGKSLIEQTIERLANFKSPILLTTKKYQESIAARDALKDLECIYEPYANNTGPAVALLCRYLQMQGKESEVVGLFPSDHYIEKVSLFNEVVSIASSSALENDSILTIGIKPTEPATGYGYINIESNHAADVYSVNNFIEKPNQALAENLIQDESNLWNSGIYIFKVSTMITEFKKKLPFMWKTLMRLNQDLSNVEEIYNQLEKISLDKCLIEKVENLKCIPADLGWVDLGSWDQISKLDGKLNLVSQEKKVIDNNNSNFICSETEKDYIFIDVENLIVVDSDQGLLVCHKNSSEKIKPALEELKKSESKDPESVRPWGQYEVISDENNFKFKRITVKPQKRLSYQSHQKRSEHWIVLKGQAKVTLNDEEINLSQGQHIFIDKEAKHRIENPTTDELVFLEVQLGESFCESDIVRYEDDYGRVKKVG